MLAIGRFQQFRVTKAAQHNLNLFNKRYNKHATQRIDQSVVSLNQRAGNIMRSVKETIAPTPDVLAVWREAEAVCFDVDSTLCTDESIDELAAFLGCGDEVAAVTKRAMEGSMTFQEALKLRLSAMKPSKQSIEEFLEQKPASLSPGIPELIKELQSRGVKIYLVSGGFRIIINPIAQSLNIPIENVFANTILFNEDGSYAGFEKQEFTSRAGGKREAASFIRKVSQVSKLVMVGDGATDLEAKHEDGACLFLGFGGIAERSIVKEQADWYVYEISKFTQALSSG